MVSLSTIETIVRDLIEDFSRTQTPGDVYTFDTSSVFELSETSVISVTDVFRNNVELGSGNWSYNSSTNKVTISSSLTVGDTIDIRYSYYSNYSSSEIQSYIKAAITKLSINNFRTFIVENSNIYPEPIEEEKNLLAVVASILINPPRLSLRLPDISIAYPKDLNTDEKIKRIIAYYKQTSGHGKFLSGVITVAGGRNVFYQD